MKNIHRRLWVLGLAFATLAFLSTTIPSAFAQQSQSTNYRVNEAFFGTGGNLQACGTAYCAKQSAGELTVGNIKSGAWQAQAGFNTDRVPSLTVVLLTPTVDVGVLDTTSTKTGTAQFSVLSYLASGYVVQTSGAAPTNGSYTMAANSSPTAPSIGAEQFGMNVVDNATPNIGDNPFHTPDFPSDPFGFGQAATGYDTANTYKYVNGNVIAQSPKSSGTTTYTISYIFNISPVTPGGTYTMNQSIVATSTF